MYDPQLGRWHVIDPAIENNHYDYTPYAYTYNNPINLIDPFGMDSTNVNTSNTSTNNQTNEEVNQDLIPEIPVSDNTQVQTEEPVVISPPSPPTCDDLEVCDINISLVAGDFELSIDGVSVGGITVVSGYEGIDLGVVGYGIKTETYSIMEPGKIDDKDIYVTSVYRKTVEYAKFGFVKGSECTVSKNGVIIEKVRREGYEVPIQYKKVGGSISVMPFKK